MNLQQLRHFVAVVEHGHFARAAEAIHLSQPALSRSIQTLESQLGCKLLDRHSRGISLTAHGELVLEHARRLLSGSRALTNAVAQLRNLEAGELRLGAGPYPAARLVPAAMGQMAMAYPGVQIRLTIDGPAGLQRRLLDDDLELFIADTRVLLGDPLLDVEPLTPHRGVIFCRPDHPLASLAAVPDEALTAYPLAAASLPKSVEQQLARVQSRAQPISIYCDNFVALRAMARTTDVLGVAPWDAVADDVGAGSLTVLTLASPIVEHSSYGLVSRAGHSLSPAARVFAEQLRIEDKRALPSRTSPMTGKIS
ncbi:LysR family transcriptional regulator [Halopseudomonas nanhaiensis]|uniref:LysR family transcriptional regulator n=1 Tax=Halopseudomonas nanhaiensis TaxID=2830842 RepID=UPI001CBDD5F3|nr:LysR family transcriptional regulator [Halopseudomonas nanhaiensis]UAW99049.1 LysR family transcriptional regulator [Halopseudomonas nanhaiensis]